MSCVGATVEPEREESKAASATSQASATRIAALAGPRRLPKSQEVICAAPPWAWKPNLNRIQSNIWALQIVRLTVGLRMYMNSVGTPKAADCKPHLMCHWRNTPLRCSECPLVANTRKQPLVIPEEANGVMRSLARLEVPPQS